MFIKVDKTNKFLTEKDIQDYIWEHRNNLYDLIENAQFPDEINTNEPWKIKPYELILI